MANNSGRNALTRGKSGRKSQHHHGDEYETIESRPKTSRALDRTRRYQYREMTIHDIPQWTPVTPRMTSRTPWTLRGEDDPPNTIRTHRPDTARPQTSRLHTARPETSRTSTVRPITGKLKTGQLSTTNEKDWSKFSAQLKMYLPRNVQFLLNEPEVFRRLMRDPDWLARLTNHLSEEIMTYLRVVRSARVKTNKISEVARVASVAQKNDLDIVRLPLVKAWENSDIPATKLELGKASVGESQKSVIFIGCAGTGKSTLVDSMVNYVLGVKWEDTFRLRVSGASETKSWINAYSVPSTNHTKLPYTLNVIDFPPYVGTGDGADASDDAWMANFKRFFNEYHSHKIATIHTICFVEKAEKTSVSSIQKSVCQQLIGLFGDDVKQNMCNLMTFAEKDEEDIPMKQALESENLPHDNCFLFNNEALYHGCKKDREQEREEEPVQEVTEQEVKKAKEETKQDMNNENKEQEDSEFFKKFWDQREENFNKIFNAIERMKPKSLVLNEKQMTEREDMAARVNHLRVMIQGSAQKLQRIQEEKKILHEHKGQLAKQEDFAYKILEAEKIKRQGPNCGDNVTNCSICFTTCHKNCAIAKDEDKARCAAMTDGFCTVCDRKCKWDKHYNRVFVFYLRIQEKDKKLSQLLKEYHTTHDGVKQALNAEHCETEQTLKQSLETSRRGVNAMRKSGGGEEGAVSQNEFIDMVIHEELREGTAGWKQRIDILVKMKGTVTMKLKGVNSPGKLIK